ncbi:MAG: hypothetical protein GY896_21035, partial [Gammaproteobacteria bacterium]|nr:hypothetical protein [Gammaproteobacteria bacterium]
QAIVSGTTVGTVSEDGPLTSTGLISISDQDTSDNPVSLIDVSGVVSDNGYGNFTLGGGNWTYTLDNTNTDVQALGSGDRLNDTATFTASDGSVHLVSIVINGVNDLAVFSGEDTGTVTEDESVTDNNLVTSGTLEIVDPDALESSFVAETVAGSYGEVSINTAGNWTYSVDNSLAAIQGLNEGETLTDRITVRSIDGTSHDVVVRIYGAGEYIPVTVTPAPIDDIEDPVDEVVEDTSTEPEQSTD